jgi:predicted nucleotidyltransferase
MERKQLFRGGWTLIDPLAEAFELFDQRVQPSAQQRDGAELRGRRVSQLLSQNSQVAECRVIGSLARSTAIQRYSDVDILAVFDPQEVVVENPETLLQLTTQMVASTNYTATRTQITISLMYPDWPNVDILPGLAVGSKGQAFHIPAAVGRGWQPYFPDQHDGIVKNGSTRLGPRFKTLVRAIKWWNGINGGPLQSYEIEEIINDLFDTKIPDYAEAIFEIFSTIHKTLADGTRDSPAYINIRTAWLLSRQARELAIEGRDMQGVESSFRRLLGEQFSLVRS